jgi:predicted TIM-barrel fold metal-dependent hydrolase
MPTPQQLGVDAIVDAHIHVWRRADLGWLHPPLVRRIFGDYAPLCRDYPVEEYVADARAAGVGAAVYVQPNWPIERCVEEVEWVAGLHAAHGWPQAIVGAADLFDPDAAAVLERQRAASALLRGTRVQLHWHADERLRYAAAPDLMSDSVFARNVALLGEIGLLFELQVFPPQMQDAADLVAQASGTTFVLVHAGMLESLRPEHTEPWRVGLELLASRPNVVVKLSGQGTFAHRVDEPLIRHVTETALALFGSERCLFGSNFPIESLWTDYRTLVDAWLRVLADQPVQVRRDVLAETARRVYGMAAATAGGP